MVGAMTIGAVRVPVAVIARQQPFQRVDQIFVRTGAGLDDRDPGCRVRDEHIQQAIAQREAEPAHRVGEIHDAALGGVDFQQIGLHPVQPTEEPGKQAGNRAGKQVLPPPKCL